MQRRSEAGASAGTLVTVACFAALSGCSTAAHTPLDDDEQIVRAVLMLQVADGRPVCIDRSTAADPLTNWRTMSKAPQQSRAMLGWSAPRAVRSLNALGARRLIDDQVHGRGIVLREPDNAPRLSLDLQRGYDAAARGQSLAVDQPSVTIRDGWGGPSAVVRWWGLNRVAPTCSPSYQFSDPTWHGKTGFLTVKSDHLGTTYALMKGSQGWKVTAQWTPWLY